MHSWVAPLYRGSETRLLTQGAQTAQRERREAGALASHEPRVTSHPSRCTGRAQSWLGVDADVVDKHLLRKHRGAIGRAGPIAAYGDVQNDEEGMIENPRAAGGPLGIGERRVEVAVHIKTHHAGLPLDSKEVKIVGKCLAGRQRENRSGVARADRGAGAVKRAVNRSRLLADVFHDVEFAAPGPAGGGDVIAKQPESGPHSLPRGNLDARFKATVSLAE